MGEETRKDDAKPHVDMSTEEVRVHRAGASVSELD